MLTVNASNRSTDTCCDIQTGFTFIISGEGKAGHRLQAVGAAHHQRTGAPLRLGGAGGRPRPKAANSRRPVERVNQTGTRVQAITQHHTVSRLLTAFTQTHNSAYNADYVFQMQFYM